MLPAAHLRGQLSQAWLLCRLGDARHRCQCESAAALSMSLPSVTLHLWAMLSSNTPACLPDLAALPFH